MSKFNTSILWARSFLETPGNIILDTETTGLESDAEIVQLAAINARGETLINTLVNPACSIPAEVTAIHHITNEMVQTAPMWIDVYPQLQEIVRGKLVVTYNADFDMRMIRQSGRRFGYLPDLAADAIECAMKVYAIYYGRWSSYSHSYRWQPLRGGDHTALGDCLATLKLIKDMAATQLQEITHA